MRKVLAGRHLRWVIGRQVFAAIPALRRRYAIATTVVDIREVAEVVAEEMTENGFVIPRALIGYFERYAGAFDGQYAAGTLVLPHRFCVFCLRNTTVLGHTGAFIHLPSGHLVDASRLNDQGTMQRLSNTFRPRPFAKIVAVPGPAISLLSIWKGHLHYGHFLLQRLRHLVAMLKVHAVLQSATVVVREHLPPYQQVAIDQLCRIYPSLKILPIATDVRVEFEDLYVPAEITPHQTGWFARKDMLEDVRDLYLDSYGLSSTSPAARRIYLSRSRQKLRRLHNETEVWPILAAEGYELMHPEQVRHHEQVAAMLDALEVFAPSGSAIGNTIFCRPGTKIWLTGPSDIHRPIWVGLALAMDHHFAFLPGGKAGRQDRFSLDPSELKRALAASRKLPSGG